MLSSSNAAELKAQGVAEAARDPNSNVTAEDAEKVMADESKKAGIPAYRFDPNASPAEKAAAARAAVPSNFHHEKKPAGVGIVTDMGKTGPDEYNLPPPSKDGAIASPSSPTAPTGANGHIHRDEKETYEQKTGWAPRFGLSTMTEAEANESLLDHTTMLEGKLDDKFFGDWYHNTGVIIFACIATWVVTLLGGGLGWVFIVMACCGTYYRTSIRRVRRNFRDDVSREMAKARLETDVESLEWINSFLVKFWPIYAPVLCETIINSVDQVLSTSTPPFLDSLRMKFFTLGTKPPRLDHVKTYPKVEDDIVLMDWKFSFTPGDRMDLTARQLKEKINPKVTLEVRIGKGVVSKGLDVIVEDLAFSGLMRVKVKLQIPFPHVERVDICFLGRPEIDYVCKPLGGDMLGFDINFIPGLESFIKEQIHANLAPIMYDPNVFPIEIAKMLSGSAVDQAIGVLAVTLHGAQALKNPDNFAGTPDPYVQVSLNGRASLGKTKTIRENANPRWNETVYVIVTALTDTLTLQVFDYNEYRKDKDLGTASFALDKLEGIPEHENLQLEVMATGKQRGVLQADVRFYPVLEGLKLDDGSTQPPPESNTGIARFTVEQAKDLDGSKSLVGQLNPYAVLLLNGHEIHQTGKLKRTNQPIWSNGSKEFLVTDRKTARLGVVIKDERDLSADAIVGTYQIKLDDMMKMMEQGKEWYNLSGAAKGRAKLTLQWKPVALKGITGGSGGYITPIGVMRLHFQNARNLRNVETMGKSDPYVRVLLSGIEKGKTVTFQNNLNPDWDEVIYVPVHSARERLTLEVMDYQNIGKDRSLGLIELPAADYVREDPETGAYHKHDEKRLQSEGLRMHGRGQAKGVLNFTAAFYPTIPTVDPEEEEAEKRELEEAMQAEKDNAAAGAAAAATTAGRARSNTQSTAHSRTTSKGSTTARRSIEGAGGAENGTTAGKIDTSLKTQLDAAEKVNGIDEGEKEVPKIRLTVDDLTKYESGLLIFKLISGEFARTNVRLEVVMDDHAFPSYTSSKARSRNTEFGETGDAMVREVDLSRITLRLVDKEDKKGGESSDHVLAKLSGELLPVLQKCLYAPSELTLKGNDGSVSKIKVLMKYLPIEMRLDPSESMNNMGTLRVDVLDAADLPSADRNGYSDPYCKFELNGENVHKTKVQKKTLHPAWNEFFEANIPSRTAAKFMVKIMDWDFGDKADFLGEADINLEVLEPMQSREVTLTLNGTKGPGTAGVVRLRLLFKASYVTRSRQGSSTFSGSIGPAGKVLGAPVKGVGKVGGAVGGGVVKGASFLRHGFKSSSNKDGRPSTSGDDAVMSSPVPPNSAMTNGDTPIPSIETPQRSAALVDRDSPAAAPAASNASTPTHNRISSFGSRSFISGTSGAGKGDPGSPGMAAAASGSAEFSVLSASDYPPNTKIQVVVRQMLPPHHAGGKSHHKDVLKTKPVKSGSGGKASWEGSGKSTRFSCSPDAQFQVVVRDVHSLFGGGDDLGETLYHVDDSSEAGSERVLKVGPGSVVIHSKFVPGAASGGAAGGAAAAASSGGAGGGLAPDSASIKDSPRSGMRRSLLSKRDPNRQTTPS